MDGFGYTGAVLHFALNAALFGSAVLLMIFLWRRGRLDFDESPKIKMMEKCDE